MGIEVNDFVPIHSASIVPVAKSPLLLTLAGFRIAGLVRITMSKPLNEAELLTRTATLNWVALLVVSVMVVLRVSGLIGHDVCVMSAMQTSPTGEACAMGISTWVTTGEKKIIERKIGKRVSIPNLLFNLGLPLLDRVGLGPCEIYILGIFFESIISSRRKNCLNVPGPRSRQG